MALQPLAEVTFENGYAGLIAAFRARSEQRRIAITGEEVAQVAGLANFYLAKILSPSSKPAKRFGATSLGPILAVLGLKLLVVEDAEAVKTYGARIPPRHESFVHAATMEIKFTRRKFRQIQAKGRKARWDNMTAKQRSAWARKLNRIRWQRELANGAAAER